MFKDEVLQQINIKSDVLTEKYVRDQSCQTKQINYEEKSNQAVSSVENGCQTDSNLEPVQSTRMRIDTSKKLTDFVLKVYPTIVEQLTANLRSHAFDDYHLISDEQDDVHEPECKHTISSTNNPNFVEGLIVSALSWNSIGSILAVAHSVLDHDSWCTHQSFISLSSLNRQNLTTEIQPDKIIDTDACITAIAFNPHQPALLVGGNFSGRIDVWDLSKDDNHLVAMSGKDTTSHNEVVNDIIWLQSSSHIHRFVSVGSDSNIFFWSFDQLRQQLNLLKTFSLTSDVIPRGNQARSLKAGLRIGVTCLTVHPQQIGTMFVGTESGCVLKCLEITRESKDPSFAIQSYEGHEAVVNAIDFSTHTDDIFITGASDMCVHVYSVAQMKPLHKIDPCTGYIFDAKWSSSTSALFYASTSSGKLLTYEIKDNEALLVSSLQVSKGQSALRKIALNKNRSNLMATSLMNSTKVWKFPSL